MIKVIPFLAAHLAEVGPQNGQDPFTIAPECHEILEQLWSFTVVDEQARVVMCAGALPDDDGQWWGWAAFSPLARRRMLALTRAVLGIMPSTPAGKIRIAVEPRSLAGHNWAHRLGFDQLRIATVIDGRKFATYERNTRCGC